VHRSDLRDLGQLLVREPAFGTQEVERPVGHDPVQPRPERPPFVEPLERGERPLEAVCGDVVREGTPTGDRERGAPRVAPVAPKETGSGFSVASARPPYQVTVTRFTHSSAVSYEREAFARPARENTPGVSDWEERDGALEREFELPSFRAAIDFVDRLADLAESADHHPDIDIRYRRVTVRWSTHSAGGITEKDREMAEQTSALAAA
jgi:4a-hydroxytetrahydrobiopterin dehydratase